ncbi:MAG: pilus assembly protein PilM, partial [Patescibacteria group bacterium]
MKLLNKKSIGLDIADRTMELAEIESSDSDFKVLNLISANLSEGIVENGQIKDKVKLAEAVKLLFSDAKSKPLSSRKIVFALPESQVFLRNFALGAHDKKNRDELARREALLSVPIREDDLVFSYRVISE